MFRMFRKNGGVAPARMELPGCEATTDILASIVPLVKAVSFESGAAQSVDLPEEEAPISRAFVSDLVILYAEDRSSHFEFISRRRLQELGFGEDALHALALENLPRRLPKIEVHGAPPRQMVTAGGNFEAALLLYDGLWAELEKKIDGELLAVVPARDLLFISDSAWVGAREFLADVANKDLQDKSHVLSRRVLRRFSGKWVPDELSS